MDSKCNQKNCGSFQQRSHVRRCNHNIICDGHHTNDREWGTSEVWGDECSYKQMREFQEGQWQNQHRFDTNRGRGRRSRGDGKDRGRQWSLGEQCSRATPNYYNNINLRGAIFFSLDWHVCKVTGHLTEYHLRLLLPVLLSLGRMKLLRPSRDTEQNNITSADNEYGSAVVLQELEMRTNPVLGTMAAHTTIPRNPYLNYSLKSCVLKVRLNQQSSLWLCPSVKCGILVVQNKLVTDSLYCPTGRWLGSNTHEHWCQTETWKIVKVKKAFIQRMKVILKNSQLKRH